MPMYVYACQKCRQMLERRQSFQDAPLSECEECGGELRRVLQPVGVIFRGSGFYSTDYRANGKSSASDGHGKDGAATAESSTSTSASSSSKSSTATAPAAASTASHDA